MVFHSLEEFRKEIIKRGACAPGVAWVDSQSSFEEVLKNVCDGYRLWCVNRGFSQFITPEWLKTQKGAVICYTVAKNTQFFRERKEEFASVFSKPELKDSSWLELLTDCPELAEFCDLSMFRGSVYLPALIRRRPELIKVLPVETLSREVLRTLRYQGYLQRISAKLRRWINEKLH